MGQESEKIRERSGSFNSSDPLTQFFYLLARDHLAPGTIEEIMKHITTQSCQFSNGWLAQYAQDLAFRMYSLQSEIKIT